MSFNKERVHGQEVAVTELRFHGAAVLTLGGAVTIDKDAPSLLILDAGGSVRVVTMPAEADVEGKVFFIVNVGGETLTINDDTGTPVLIISLLTAESCMIGVVAGVWRVLMQGASA